MNYYKRHIGDYMKDASHLSLLEHGIYMRLLDVYYTREAPIPVDQAARLIGARSKEEKEALCVVASEFFQEEGGFYVQARCEREIKAMQQKAETNREVGKRGGRPRKQTQKDESGNPEETQTVSVSNPNETLATSHKPLTSNSVPDGTDGAAVQPADMPKDELWKAGKSLLAQSGMPAAQCGSFVGKLVKDYGDQIVVDAVRAAVVERPADAPSFLKAACQRAAGTRPAAGRKPSSHMGLASQDYTAGVNLDGTFA